ncbi:hypothetical protein [uncultured Streptococcus sp.]|jgi:hypothetical protein|uniref:hypothetical protein n=1 Tax=uncultured Streptococcus sp. TaxID=83427 RepID=UPI002056722F|nr:hypothetical protein [uncultured Streptococcus sp.]MDU0953369.1 hypothetical protein [Streptococcus oralis]DAS63040.1 MAG TPA: hypothetical protein [Bacteriophage sp.]DAX88294.1 MAG TPA: hypothetical protein [Caudoviricetes sp.]
MKNYLNKYNVINFTIFILLIFFIIERLATFLIIQIHLETLYYFVMFIWILRLITASAFSVLLITISIDFISRRANSDSFINSIKSYLATWKIRRYCTHINVEPSMEESSRYLNTKQVIVKKVNRSLKALTVTYYKDCAVLNGRLPSNNESADIVEKLFPKIKKELNYLDKDYQFNDIIRDPEGKNFSSVAKCNIGAVYPIKNNDG